MTGKGISKREKLTGTGLLWALKKRRNAQHSTRTIRRVIHWASKSESLFGEIKASRATVGMR
jgi:hypothetical protein